MCDDDYMGLHDPGTVGLIGAFTVVGRSVGRQIRLEMVPDLCTAEDGKRFEGFSMLPLVFLASLSLFPPIRV